MRVFLVALLIAGNTFAQGRNDHVRPYLEGLQASEERAWATVVAKMSEAIGHQPQEMKSLRVRGGVIEYVPHFWLGVAYAHQERWEDALHELGISEQHGVIQGTTLYAQLRSTRSRAESRIASSSTAVGIDQARQLADAAMKGAVSAHARATSAGAARLEEFRQGTQRLSEATDSRKAGTVEGFRRAASRAEEATRMFEAAAARAVAEAGARGRPSGALQQTESRAVAVDPAVEQAKQPSPVRTPPPVAEPEEPTVRSADPEPVRAVERDTQTSSMVDRSKAADTPRDSSPARPMSDPAPERAPRAELRGETSPSEAMQAAYLALVEGRLDTARRVLDDVLLGDPQSVDGLVLRGHLHYLESVFSRQESLRESAKADFRAALVLDPRIRLDEGSFSPKVIEFFESVRASM